MNEHLHHTLQGFGLEHHLDTLLTIALPAIKLESIPTDDTNIPIGNSKFGGRPDMPTTLTWPRNQRGPLHFFLQINLAELPTHLDLPATGWLYFFYDSYVAIRNEGHYDKTSWRVLYANVDHSQLQRVTAPDVSQERELDYFEETQFQYNSCLVHFQEMLSFPSPFSRHFHALPLSLDEKEDYRDFYREYMRPYGPDLIHRLRGYPTLFQNDMEEACEFMARGIDMLCPPENIAEIDASIQPSDLEQWHMLLQLGADPNTSFDWGFDSGCGTFWLRRNELEQLQFDQALCVVQF